MIREALELILEQSRPDHPKPHVRQVDRRTRAVCIHGEETTEVIDPPEFHREALAVASFAAWVGKFRGDDPVVSVDVGSAYCLLDNNDRREGVVLPFERSPQFQALEALGRGTNLRDLCRVLRTDLAGCVGDEVFRSVLGALKFDVMRESRQTATRTRESMGRSVEKEVANADGGQLPDTVVAQLPLLASPADVPTEIRISCSVEVDLERETVALVPTGDTVHREVQRVVAEIADRIGDALDARLQEDQEPVLVVIGRQIEVGS